METVTCTRCAGVGSIHKDALANATGECDTCHGEPCPVYREDSEEGWQECERCSAARAGRRAVKAAMRKAGL